MSDKKKLTGQQVSFLLKKAHKLKPVVMIGKNGLTESVISAVSEALKDHELIKLKFVDCKKDRKEFSFILEEKTGSALIKIIGNTAYFFKPAEDPDDRRHELPKGR